MITEKQIENYSDAVCEGVVLGFYLWAKRNNWHYMEGRNEWYDGMVSLPHHKVFKMFLQSCQIVTHVNPIEASENSGSVQ
jgi:hypothetical protein